MREKRVLVSLKISSAHRPEEFKKIGDDFLGLIEWLKISALYRAQRKLKKSKNIRDLLPPDRLESFCSVAVGKSKGEALPIYEALLKIENKYNKSYGYKVLSMNMLFYGELILRVPQLTLPYPDLHLHPEELIPAAEVAPDFVHPILNKRLIELVKDFENEAWGEYYGPAVFFMPTT